MNARDYVRLQVERTRGQLRATSFLHMGSTSLELGGKTLHEFVEDLKTANKKPIELVDVTAMSDTDSECALGDIVSLQNVFTTNEGIIWDGTNIRFQTLSGAVVSPNQYEYLQNQVLGPAQVFVEAEQGMQSVKSVWKSISRNAREARNDKAKEIFYVTFGELIWDNNPGKKGSKKMKSPLYIMPIKEEETSTGIYKFKITQPILKQNSVLRREIMQQIGVNLYDGCDDNVSLEKIEQTLLTISQTVQQYIGNMRVDVNAFHICILDSQGESVCQAIEKNIDAISESKLTKILSGELSEEECRGQSDEACAVLFPLPADESQKKVVEAVLGGQSVYAPAPAGAGKSQTSVNIAANLATQGKRVCVMSEHLAANEVFLEYAKKIGLDQYCLSINSRMKTADIVKQIKTISKISRQYVHTTRAKETVKCYAEAIEKYKTLSDELYKTDPVLQSSLYELISLSVSAQEFAVFDAAHLKKSDYAGLRSALLDIHSSCFAVMTDGEFTDYFYHNSCFDKELQTMLQKSLAPFYEKGVDLVSLIRDNHLSRLDATRSVLANLARKLALDIIGENNLYEVGNRHVKSVYKSLVEMHLQMQQLYVSYMHQELSSRIADNVDDKLIGKLDKLKTSRVTPQELFSVYGKEILAICPIVITTPTAASNYIYGTGLDDFHTMIVDEASQMQIVSILPYTDRTKQLVVFGDSMQLGIPSTFMKRELVNAEDALKDSAYSDRSVLQAAQGRFPSYALKYHYRSGTEMLIHVSNETCYDGLLEIIPDSYTDRAALPSDLGLEMIQVQSPVQTKKGENESEAREIANRVAALKKAFPKSSIGVITFNEPQHELISDFLEETLDDYVDNEKLWVRALENAQGKEADYVFISIGHFRRNRDGSLHMGISEINRVGGENRLNVMFTRARRKNFVVLSFDYKELKRSDNAGVKRLYEYLDYAANGKLNEVSTKRLSNTDHAVVQCMADMMENINPSYETQTRIGSENMAVDIAVKENGNPRYSLGVLMQSFGQTPQEAVTKILVLEKAGWHISPVSPIYFLTSEREFRSQIERDIQEPVSFTPKTCNYFDTEQKPDSLFCAKDFGYGTSEDAEEAAPITEDDFLAMNLLAFYEKSLPSELWSEDLQKLNEMAKQGNTEANLVLLILLKERFLKDGKLRVFVSNVNRLYSVHNERKAGFLLAQVLRIQTLGDNKSLITKLLKEAKEMRIGGK